MHIESDILPHSVAIACAHDELHEKQASHMLIQTLCGYRHMHSSKSTVTVWLMVRTAVRNRMGIATGDSSASSPKRTLDVCVLCVYDYIYMHACLSALVSQGRGTTT